MTTYINTREELLHLLPKNLVFAELGVFKGDFSKVIVNTIQPKILYLVDIFSGNMGSGDKNGQNFEFIDMDQSYRSLVQYFNSVDNVSILKNTTYEFLHNIEPNMLDAVYIDADHSYDNVKQDLELSFSKIKNNGFIMGHDYCPKQFPGVCRAVNEFCTLHSQQIKYIANDILPSFCIQKEDQ
jgi:hypothetical protein